MEGRMKIKLFTKLLIVVLLMAAFKILRNHFKGLQEAKTQAH